MLNSLLSFPGLRIYSGRIATSLRSFCCMLRAVQGIFPGTLCEEGVGDIAQTVPLLLCFNCLCFFGGVKIHYCLEQIT